MSYPPRPPMGMPPFMSRVPMGMPPPMFFGGPPPNMRPSNQQQNSQPSHNHFSNRGNSKNTNNVIQAKPNLIPDHPSPIPTASGPVVAVFVGNITEKWPDAMIRQLLATCGQVINWRRVQGASGKLQAFGFCEFNGPDAGLRAVRLLHDLEVGDKKLVVKVDAKTSSVLDKFKADKKKTKGEKESTEAEIQNEKQIEDYMDKEMLEMDERSKLRIDIIFREFKMELDQYVAAGGNERAQQAEKEPPQAGKPAIQDKLHLLKLSSLDPTPNDNPPEDLEVEEGKREIISQEIGRFREYMKQEKEKEEERKKLGRERREKDRDRDVRDDRIKRIINEGSPGRRLEGSPAFGGNAGGRRSRERSPPRRGDRRRSRERDFDRVARDHRDRGRDRDREMRDRDRMGGRRSRDRRSASPRRDRDRSPMLGSKSKYREREEEEEALDQKRQERRAREKEVAYEEKLRGWEKREAKKAKDLINEKDRQRRMEDDAERDAKKMKQFLEDYDDHKHDLKYYRGKEFQKRLAERAKELESDNKDRQKEREELEEMRLRMLTTGGSQGGNLLDKYKKGPELVQAPVLHLTSSIRLERAKKPAFPASSVNSRLLQIAGQNQNPQQSAISQALHQLQQPTQHQPHPHVQHQSPSPITPKPEAISIPQKSPLPVNVKSNGTTPNSHVSPAMAPEMSPSIKSLTSTGFQLNNLNIKKDDDESRQSFSDGNSGGGPSPLDGRDDDSSFGSPDFPKKKKINVHEIFNQDEDENDGFGSARKRKLVPLDYGDEKKRKDDKSQEDKKKHIKSLIEKIPTDKEALFAYIIDWEMVDTALMERRIRPWINKKIVEYIGEPEPTLVDFICSKVLARSAPQSILDDVMQVLDEEAEVFVVKMWRLLVYEIEAKKFGVVVKS